MVRRVEGSSCLDSYRFQVLAEFHIETPMTIEEERRLWDVVNQAIGLGEEPIALNYHFPKASL